MNTPSADDSAGASPPPSDRYASAKTWGLRLLALGLLAAAAWVIWRQLHHLSWHELKHAFAAWGPWRIGASIAASLASYVCLAINEWAGLRWAGARVPPWTIFVGSFCLNAFAHTLGTAVVVGAAVRLKVYAAQRVTLAEIVKVTAFTNVSFSLGIAGIAGAGLLITPAWRLHAVHLAPEVARIVGVALLLTIPAYVILCACVRGVFSLLKHQFVLPTWKWAIAQVVIGVVDNVLTVLIPWVLLPSKLIGFGAFTGAFAVATVTGVVSSVPAGAGVFESVLLTLLPHVDRAPLAAAFVGYRLFYFIIPLAMAGLILALMGRTPPREADAEK
ncbi:MAG TPA: hypothetical protein VG407_03475 [Caulobacteraceae bacterium]|jgi:uncharacterized membrane protein YbhN (UPF0104 family)|nr:hypothetical protein [Caulobacteraceae bacterium]